MTDHADAFFWFMLDLVAFHPDGVVADHEHDRELGRLGSESGFLEHVGERLRPTEKGREFVEQSRRAYRI